MDVASWWVRICSLVSHSADAMFASDFEAKYGVVDVEV